MTEPSHSVARQGTRKSAHQHATPTLIQILRDAELLVSFRSDPFTPLRSSGRPRRRLGQVIHRTVPRPEQCEHSDAFDRQTSPPLLRPRLIRPMILRPMVHPGRGRLREGPPGPEWLARSQNNRNARESATTPVRERERRPPLGVRLRIPFHATSLQQSPIGLHRQEPRDGDGPGR